MFHESDLFENERRKYSRQVIVPGVGIDNQKKLRKSSVLIVGCGGLGCPLIMYLGSCGIGKLGIVDHDKVEIHNLQRQILYKESDIGSYKVDKAYDFVKDINSDIELVKYKLKFDSNFSDIEKYNIIVDCTDNIQTRYILSDLSRYYKKNFICASVIRWEGHLYNLMYGGPCYRCLYPNIKKITTNCDENGIIGPICGIFGSFLGLEVIKTCLGMSKTKLITFNGLTDKYASFNLRKINPECLACNSKKIERFLDLKSCEDKFDSCLIPRIQWEEVLNNFNDFLIVDIRNSIQFKMFRIKNSINIPLKELEKNVDKINKSKKILILCKRGISSLKGAQILINQSIECFSINGGISAYEEIYINKN